MVSSNMFLITFVTLITTALGTTTIIVSASPSVSVTPSSSGNTSAQSSVGVLPSAFGNTSVQSASANNNQGNTIVPSASATANNNQAGNPGQSAATNNNPGNTNPGNTIMPSASGNPGQSATSNNPGNTIMPSGSSGSLAVSSIYFNLSDPSFADKFFEKYKHLFSEFSCTNKASCCEGEGNSTIKVKVKDCNKNFPGHCNVNSTFEVKEKLCLDVTVIPCCSRAAFLNTSLVFIFLGLFLHLVRN